MTEAIVEALGGKKILGPTIHTGTDLRDLIRKGLPAEAIPALAGQMDMSNGGMSEKLGIPQRTLTRRLAENTRLSAAESDRTVRFARVYTTAVEMIGDREKAVEWLQTPNRALGDQRPFDQLDTDMGAREVEDILGRIAYGVYS